MRGTRIFNECDRHTQTVECWVSVSGSYAHINVVHWCISVELIGRFLISPLLQDKTSGNKGQS